MDEGSREGRRAPRRKPRFDDEKSEQRERPDFEGAVSQEQRSVSDSEDERQDAQRFGKPRISDADMESDSEEERRFRKPRTSDADGKEERQEGASECLS